MTTTEFKINMKQTLDKVDAGETVLITRGGKIYTVKPYNAK
jgi:antitoxin (DNA-binding transcriptional repressor) of toxin-antitoxin stability system